MRYQRIAVLIVAAPLAAFAIAGSARHPTQESRDQTIQDQSKPVVPEGTIMGPGMNGTPSRMMTRHEEICETVDRLMESMTAIENEKDPAALKSRLAEHRALLEHVRDQVIQQSMMYEMGRAPRVPPRPRVWK
jgi:hypothetical protein